MHQFNTHTEELIYEGSFDCGNGVDRKEGIDTFEQGIAALKQHMKDLGIEDPDFPPDVETVYRLLLPPYLGISAEEYDVLIEQGFDLTRHK